MNRGESKSKEHLVVSIGVIRKAGKIFIQKRKSEGLLGGLWEFPGGKLEKNETPNETLHREIQEEVGIRIKNIRPLRIIKHAYTRFKVELHCYEADYDSGEINLQAATDFKWVSEQELPQFPFPAANIELIAQLLKKTNYKKPRRTTAKAGQVAGLFSLLISSSLSPSFWQQAF